MSFSYFPLNVKKVEGDELFEIEGFLWILPPDEIVFSKLWQGQHGVVWSEIQVEIQAERIARLDQHDKYQVDEHGSVGTADGAAIIK